MRNVKISKKQNWSPFLARRLGNRMFWLKRHTNLFIRWYQSTKLADFYSAVHHCFNDVSDRNFLITFHIQSSQFWMHKHFIWSAKQPSFSSDETQAFHHAQHVLQIYLKGHDNLKTTWLLVVMMRATSVLHSRFRLFHFWNYIQIHN